MPAHKRLRHHKAKIEYRAWKEAIFQMMEQGYSKRLIHEELSKDGRISMAYITLCQFIRNSKKSAPMAPAAESKPPPKPASGPRHVAAPSNKFPDPRDMNPNEAL